MSASICRLFCLITMLTGLLVIAGCGGSGGGSSTPPEPNDAPAPASSFSYTFVGSVIKGVISSARVSVVDVDGNQLGTTTLTGDNGEFQLAITTSELLQLPLQLQVSGTGSAQIVCDVQPVCEATESVDGDTVAVTVAFGERYEFPAGFRLRAAIQDVQEQGDDTFQSIVYVSPLSEFVTATALAVFFTVCLGSRQQPWRYLDRDVRPKCVQNVAGNPGRLRHATTPAAHRSDASRALVIADLSILL